VNDRSNSSLSRIHLSYYVGSGCEVLCKGRRGQQRCGVERKHTSDALFCPSFPISRASNYNTSLPSSPPLTSDTLLCHFSLDLLSRRAPNSSACVCTAHSAMRQPTRRPPPRHAHGLPSTPPTPLTSTGLASGPPLFPPPFPRLLSLFLAGATAFRAAAWVGFPCDCQLFVVTWFPSPLSGCCVALQHHVLNRDSFIALLGMPSPNRQLQNVLNHEPATHH